MIWALIQVEWIRLKRDRVAQVLTFVLPIAFFTIFALIFGGQKGGGMGKIKLALVDEDQSKESALFVRALGQDKSLSLQTILKTNQGGVEAELALDRGGAEALVRKGTAPVALILPKGWSQTFPSFDGQSDTNSQALLLVDTSNPVAGQVVAGLMQKAAFNGLSATLARKGFEMFDKTAFLSPTQKAVVNTMLAGLEAAADAPEGVAATNAAAGRPAGMAGLVPFRSVDLLGEKKSNPVIAFYAAGIGVMFLLFSASGAGGCLLDEVENGTLERVLCSQVGMTGLLAGKWVFLTLMGVAQLSVMFLWGAVVFDVELWRHFLGFAVMTLATAAAAAGLGLALAAGCRSRSQLSGLSTLLILSMSALGGSMIPKFVMGETMQKLALLTFNGWAVEGYVKLFWRDEPLGAILPELGVLAAAAAGFFFIARRLARRWETA